MIPFILGQMTRQINVYEAMEYIQMETLRKLKKRNQLIINRLGVQISFEGIDWKEWWIDFQ